MGWILPLCATAPLTFLLLHFAKQAYNLGIFLVLKIIVFQHGNKRFSRLSNCCCWAASSHSFLALAAGDDDPHDPTGLFSSPLDCKSEGETAASQMSVNKVPLRGGSWGELAALASKRFLKLSCFWTLTRRLSWLRYPMFKCKWI